MTRAAWQRKWRWQGAAGHGASTITMQVARPLYPHRRYGTWGGKLAQMPRALQLEWSLSKESILELYFQLAPYGKTSQGSRLPPGSIFHKPPAALQWTEALALAITPKSPNAYRPDRFPPAAQKHCQRLADRLLQRQKMSSRRTTGSLTARNRLGVRHMPYHSTPDTSSIGPHWAGSNSRLVLQTVCRGRSTSPPRAYIIDSRHPTTSGTHRVWLSRELSEYGIHHAAALVIENVSEKALAFHVGSPHFDDKAYAGRWMVYERIALQARRSNRLCMLDFGVWQLHTAHPAGQCSPCAIRGLSSTKTSPRVTWAFAHFCRGSPTLAQPPEAVALNVSLGKGRDLLTLSSGRLRRLDPLPANWGTIAARVASWVAGKCARMRLTTLYAAPGRDARHAPATACVWDCCRSRSLPSPSAAWQQLPACPRRSFIITEIPGQHPCRAIKPGP